MNLNEEQSKPRLPIRRWLWSKAKSFAITEDGNFAVLFAFIITPILVAAGGAIDLGRQSSAERDLQAAVDSVTIQTARRQSGKNEQVELDILANLKKQINYAGLRDLSVDRFEVNQDFVDVVASARVDTTLLAIVQIKTLPVKVHARASRQVKGALELALVLDNTWSMSEDASGGDTKLQALKSAAKSLVDEVYSATDDAVRIALVPYADYVNVGEHNRTASWLAVPAEYTVDGSPRQCETRTTRSTCTARDPTYSCTRYTDGVPEQRTCGGGCTNWQTESVAPYQYCTGGGSSQTYRFWGCVGSRTNESVRLTDLRPAERYPGYLSTRQECLNPLVQLTDDKERVLKAIDGMVTNIGSYQPYTYIPAGLTWGQATLSKTAPFTEGLEYDPDNAMPRKVIVLMTDGDNTLQYRSSDGKHIGFSSNTSTAERQRKDTDSDTLTKCANIKSDGIEIFTVAFQIRSEQAKRVLQSCAQTADHYFDATNRDKLLESFGMIANELSYVRLVQ